jgi:hypothetical protein
VPDIPGAALALLSLAIDVPLVHRSARPPRPADDRRALRGPGRPHAALSPAPRARCASTRSASKRLHSS